MISIKKELTVKASQETAFRVFSLKMDLWWPRAFHVGKTPLVNMILEPKPKGRWYSTHEGGEVCEVGFVRDYEPNSRLVLVWQLNGEFQHDPNLTTEVEINFIARNSEETFVTFEHRNVETLGKPVEGMDQGWGLILGLFEKVATDGKMDGEALKIYQRERGAA
jgi:uncharacterized protein YndB with AHSA1/START domain